MRKRQVLATVVVIGQLVVFAQVRRAVVQGQALQLQPEPAESVEVARVGEPPEPHDEPLGTRPQHWVRIGTNLAAVDPSELAPVVKRAAAAGATGVLFEDPSLSSYSAPGNEAYAARWVPKARAFRDQVRAAGLGFVAATAPTGYCRPVLAHDPNLATGYPLRAVPLRVANGLLVAEQTIAVPNGSFEAADQDWPVDWGHVDAPGTAVFVDREISHDGDASLRFENFSAANAAGEARAIVEVDVAAFQQYRLRFWARMDGLTAAELGPRIVDAADPRRRLTHQQWSVARPDGTRQFYARADERSSDWTEISVAFNSLGATRIRIVLGVWGGSAGRLWIDDVRLDAVPLLNLVRRDGLDVTLTTDDGRQLVEEVDVAAVRDPNLAALDTYHEPDPPRLLAGSGLEEGDRVWLDGWHTLVTTNGQVGCSWHDEPMFDVLARVHADIGRDLDPDGYLLAMDEVRTGGWEPADQAYPSSGAALGAHIARVATQMAAQTGKPLYLWSDMVDPTHNAVDGYFQVAGSLEGTWEALDPALVTIVNWKGEADLANAPASVGHFAALGFSQILAGFYDHDVVANRAAWADVASDPSVVGSMHTTWLGDYSQLEAFAALWWQEQTAVP